MSDIKPQNYKDPRPAETFSEFHEYSRTRDPVFVYELVRLITTPISIAIYRTRPIEVDNVPADGPVILAANHFSNYDHFLAGAWLRRKIRFMAKSQMFKQSRSSIQSTSTEGSSRSAAGMPTRWPSGPSTRSSSAAAA